MTHTSLLRIFAAVVAAVCVPALAAAETSVATEGRAVAAAPADAGAAGASTPALATGPTAAPPAPRVSTSRYGLRPSFMLGLSQWTLFGGGNVAAQLKTGRLVFEYSHGQALHYNRVPKLTLTEAERDADVEVEMPWTTGGGVGYQITPHLHVLIEVKAHRYLLRDVARTTTEYTSLTVGPGLFYDIYLTKHLFLQPNLRWWPTLASSFDRDTALMAKDGTVYHPKRHDLPPFINVNLGWTFDAE
jgi:hypothetical protein